MEDIHHKELRTMHNHILRHPKKNATLPLHNIEITEKEVGLLLNEKKTEFMAFNLNGII